MELSGIEHTMVVVHIELFVAGIFKRCVEYFDSMSIFDHVSLNAEAHKLSKIHCLGLVACEIGNNLRLDHI